jgi:chromosome segregation ATPase
MRGDKMQQAAENSNVIVIPKRQVVEYNITDAAIKKLYKKYSGLTITDKASYDTVRSALSNVRGIRVDVEHTRKDLKADALEWGKKVDAEAKRITGKLLPLENELKATKKAEDDRKAAIKAEKARQEAARINGISDKISKIRGMSASLLSYTADELRELSAQVEAVEINPEGFMEFTADANQTKHDASIEIAKALTERLRLDKEDAERRAETERLKIEREKLEAERKEQEAERREIEEEKAWLAAEQKAEQDRLETERREIEEELIKKPSRSALNGSNLNKRQKRKPGSRPSRKLRKKLNVTSVNGLNEKGPRLKKKPGRKP